MTTKFWLQDPSILLKDYDVFYPSSNMTRIEQLNSITRFLIYLSLILFFVGKLTKEWSQGIVITLSLIIIMYFAFDSDEMGKRKELERLKNKEHMENLQPLVVDTPILESGYYDAEGNLVTGRFYSHEQNRNKKLEFTLDEMNEYKKGTCKHPTSDNPFMNPLLSDFNTEDAIMPCNADDEDIKDEIVETFNQDLYRDVGDLFDVRNSNRQFFSVTADMFDRDQTAFAEWLYKTGPTCKEQTAQCNPKFDFRMNTNT